MPSCMGFRRRHTGESAARSILAPLRNQSANKAMKIDVLIQILGSLKLPLGNLPSMPGNLLELGNPFLTDFGERQIPLFPVLDA